MKTITSAVLGLSLTLAAAGMSFAQTAAPQTATPNKMDSTSSTTGTAKPVKKHKVKKAKPAASTTAPAAAPSK